MTDLKFESRIHTQSHPRNSEYEGYPIPLEMSSEVSRVQAM